MFWNLIGIAVILLILPFSIYYSAKLGTFGYLRACELYKERSRNGDKKAA